MSQKVAELLDNLTRSEGGRFHLWAFQTEAIRNFPILIYSDIPVTFIIAPTIYFAFRMSITGKQEKPAAVLPHYIPAVCASFLVLIHNIQVVLPRMANAVLISSHLADPQIKSLSLASDLFLFVYVLTANVKAFQIYRDSGEKTRKKTPDSENIPLELTCSIDGYVNAVYCPGRMDFCSRFFSFRDYRYNICSYFSEHPRFRKHNLVRNETAQEQHFEKHRC